MNLSIPELFLDLQKYFCCIFIHNKSFKDLMIIIINIFIERLLSDDSKRFTQKHTDTYTE